MRRIAPLLVALALLGAGRADASWAPYVPRLPAHGFAVQRGRNIAFFDVRGRAAGRLPGFALVSPPGLRIRVQGPQGRVFFLDPGRRTLRPVPRGTRFSTDGAGVPHGLRHPPATAAARDAGRVGHWARGFRSPDGRTVLLQWSAECEVPIAFFLRAGRLQAVSGERDWTKAPDSVALGWLRDGRAAVQLPRLGCGGSGGRAGIYAVDPATLRRTLIVRGSGSAVMWGSA